MAAIAQLRELVESAVREAVEALDVFSRLEALEHRVQELEENASAPPARTPRAKKGTAAAAEAKVSVAGAGEPAPNPFKD